MTALLGADLEEVPGKAWSHVIDNSIAYGKARPALLIKVPHHGSKNAHCEELWNRLAQPPIAVLATYNKGGRLPTAEDVERILTHTPKAYSCSTFTKMAAQKNHDIDKFLKVLDVKRTRRFPASGQIRVRFSERVEPTIELFGNAVHLDRVH